MSDDSNAIHSAVDRLATDPKRDGGSVGITPEACEDIAKAIARELSIQGFIRAGAHHSDVRNCVADVLRKTQVLRRTKRDTEPPA